MSYLEPINSYSSLPGVLVNAKAGRLETLASGQLQNKSKADLKELSQQFESVLINQLLTVMRSTISKSGLLDSFSSDTYQSLLDQEISNKIAEGQGIGLSDMLFKELAQLDDAIKISRGEGRIADSRKVADSYEVNQ